MRDLILSRVGV